MRICAVLACTCNGGNGFLAKEILLYAEVNTENVLRSVAKVAKSTLIRVLGRSGES
jgi:hypothetical protein